MPNLFAIEGTASILNAAAGARPQNWDGYSVPMVTADEARAYAAATQNDADVAIGEVTVEGGLLVIAHMAGDPPAMWPEHAKNTQGEPLYALEGWSWIPAMKHPTLDIPDAAWTATGEGTGSVWHPGAGDERSRLLSTVTINGQDFHVEAYEVAPTGAYERGFPVQQAIQYGDDLAAVRTAAGAVGPFHTVEIQHRPYVLVLTPYC